MDVTIEKLIYGGEGLAHHEGSTVFVPFVLPAERVRDPARPSRRRNSFARALERVLDASPDRIAPPCPHFGVCGGCDYQHIPYEAQLQYKTEILRETLRRIGRIEWPGDIAVHASKPWSYRNRAQWKVRPLKDSSADEASPAELRQARHRLLSRKFHCTMRSKRLPDSFAAAAEDSARAPRRARSGRAATPIARIRSLLRMRLIPNCYSPPHSPGSLRTPPNLPRRSAQSYRKSKACFSTIPAKSEWSSSARALSNTKLAARHFV